MGASVTRLGRDVRRCAECGGAMVPNLDAPPLPNGKVWTCVRGPHSLVESRPPYPSAATLCIPPGLLVVLAWIALRAGADPSDVAGIGTIVGLVMLTAMLRVLSRDEPRSW